MSHDATTLIDLETSFWQAMVDEHHDAATALLAEPALMVGSHGAFQFDHATYRKMADQGSRVVTSFELRDVKVAFPNENTAVVTYQVRQGVASRSDRASTHAEEMHDSSTWVRSGSSWKCVIHTETPAASEAVH